MHRAWWGRSQESEADHLGLVYMAKAGYDPRAARDLWIRMAQASQGSSRPPEFLSTHPSEETRVRQIGAWLPEALRYYTHPADHALARLRALLGRGRKARFWAFHPTQGREPDHTPNLLNFGITFRL